MKLAYYFALIDALDAEFADSPEDALSQECVEFVESVIDRDTVPGALEAYFRDEGGVYA